METEAEHPFKRLRNDVPRGVVAEWTVTIILLLFGTTTLVQAFVIPMGSMEDTLLVGDHLLVDKLAYAPGGAVAKHVLRSEERRVGKGGRARWAADRGEKERGYRGRRRGRSLHTTDG